MEEGQLPDRLIELFERQAPGKVEVRETKGLGHQSILLYGDDNAHHPIEFTRGLGVSVIEQTGYAVTGIREHDEYIEVWFDSVPSHDGTHLTVAQQAAQILDNKENDTRFEANISEDEMKQYVDVFPDPHDDANEDYAIKQDELEAIREAGLRIRTMSCGRERGHFNEENYRIWFEVDE